MPLSNSFLDLYLCSCHAFSGDSFWMLGCLTRRHGSLIRSQLRGCKFVSSNPAHGNLVLPFRKCELNWFSDIGCTCNFYSGLANRLRQNEKITRYNMLRTRLTMRKVIIILDTDSCLSVDWYIRNMKLLL